VVNREGKLNKQRRGEYGINVSTLRKSGEAFVAHETVCIGLGHGAGGR
jgi:hypothetical protein